MTPASVLPTTVELLRPFGSFGQQPSAPPLPFCAEAQVVPGDANDAPEGKHRQRSRRYCRNLRDLQPGAGEGRNQRLPKTPSATHAHEIHQSGDGEGDQAADQCVRRKVATAGARLRATRAPANATPINSARGADNGPAPNRCAAKTLPRLASAAQWAYVGCPETELRSALVTARGRLDAVLVGLRNGFRHGSGFGCRYHGRQAQIRDDSRGSSHTVVLGPRRRQVLSACTKRAADFPPKRTASGRRSPADCNTPETGRQA